MCVVLLLLTGLLSLFLKLLMLPVAVAVCTLLWGIAGGIIWRLKLRRRTVVMAATILLMQCAVVLSVGEVLARVSGLAAPQRFRMFQPINGAYYELRPDFRAKVPIQITGDEMRKVPVSISTQGLRNEWVGEKTAEEIRVLCLGDSFTFGWGVTAEESIPAHFERALNDFDERGIWRVVNAGVSGYSPWQALRWLRSKGLALAPDIVLLQTFVANDLADTLTQLDDETLWLRNARPFRVQLLNRFSNEDYFAMRLDNWLYRTSHLYYLTCTRTPWDLMVYHIATGFRMVQEAALAEMPQDRDAPVEYEPDRYETYPALDTAWRLFSADLAAMRDVCAEHGAQLVAYNIPFHFSAAVQERFFADHPGVYDADRGDRQVEALFQQLDIPFIPVLEWMRDRPEIDAEYFPANLHLNEAGNQALARRLAEYVVAGQEPVVAAN